MKYILFLKKKIKDNKNAQENEGKNEIDWEYSSHMESEEEEEEFLRNKSDIKNDNSEENEKFNHFDFLDIKPIVKY